jgi:hypothetical protein
MSRKFFGFSWKTSFWKRKYFQRNWTPAENAYFTSVKSIHALYRNVHGIICVIAQTIPYFPLWFHAAVSK